MGNGGDRGNLVAGNVLEPRNHAGTDPYFEPTILSQKYRLEVGYMRWNNHSVKFRGIQPRQSTGPGDSFRAFDQFGQKWIKLIDSFAPIGSEPSQGNGLHRKLKLVSQDLLQVLVQFVDDDQCLEESCACTILSRR